MTTKPQDQRDIEAREERNAFEVIWIQGHEGGIPGCIALERHSDGGYDDLDTQDFWEAWQLACKWQREAARPAPEALGAAKGVELSDAEIRATFTTSWPEGTEQWRIAEYNYHQGFRNGARAILAQAAPATGESVTDEVRGLLQDLRELSAEVNDHTPRSFSNAVVRLGGRAATILARQRAATPPAAKSEAASDAKRLEWISKNWGGQRTDYAMHVIDRGGDGDLSDIRTFIDKQL